MTMQFLASVRRNQKQWMVVLTILSIFAFLFDDVVRGANNLTANSTAIFFAVLCAGLMSIIGYPRRHTVMYGLIGFAAGGSAALIGSSFAGPKPLVRTNVGNLTRDKIISLQKRRQKVNSFLAVAVSKIGKEAQAPNFGDTSESSMVSYSVLSKEAQRLGVGVSDEAVNRFLKTATQGKLTRADYLASLKEAEIGESELFELVRSELEAQLVVRLMFPPAGENRLMEMMTGGRMGRVAQMSPEMQWENFRRLNVKQAMTAVAIPVTEFVKQVPQPSDTELAKYFDERKSRVGDDRGNPGFLELPKVKLAYLVAADLGIYEKGLPDSTDQEVVDYYNAHLEEYRVNEIPDFGDMKLPDLKSGAESANPDAPADAASPANRKPETPDSGAADKPAVEATDKPAPEAKAPDKDEPVTKDPEKKEEEKPKDGAEKPKPESQCGEEETSAKPDDAKPEATKPAADAETAKPAAVQGDSPKPEAAAEKSESTPPAPALPNGNEQDPKLTPPKSGHRFGPIAPGQGPLAPPRYQELNDDLKLVIREKLLLEKAFAKMGVAADDAFQFMMDLSLNLPMNDAERVKMTATFADLCKKYAKDKGLEYVETKPMTFADLRNSFDDRIGSANESVSERSSRRNVRSVAEIVFETDTTGRNSRVSTYSPQRADSPKMKYAYWVTERIPSKIPDLKNEATRQLVVDAWKFEKARELAEVRAKEIAALAKKQPTDIPAALADQSINGTKESPVVTVRETPKFTWMRTSQSTPSMGLPRPEESQVDGIDGQPGTDFMRLVFEQLNDGDVGVALNRSRTVFYVVRVHDRDGAGADGGVAIQDLQQQFLKDRATTETGRGMAWPTPYDFLGAEVQNFLDQRWRQNFDKKFAITFEKGEAKEFDDE